MGLMEDLPYNAATSLTVKRALKDLLADVSIEATPRQIEGNGRLSAPEWKGMRVYVPMLPGAALLDSLESCRHLKALGLRPVPHLAARAIAGPAELDDALPGFVEAGVDAMLLIAGDMSDSAGPYESVAELLESGLLAHNGIHKLGVAGHPDGHPIADERELDQALRAKAEYGRVTGTDMWVVTQFLFEAAPLIAWEGRLKAVAVNLPVRVGLPGPSSIRALMSYAMRCGVGGSARALIHRPEVMKMLGRWRPDGLLRDIAAGCADRGESQIQGIHVYPFGGLKASLDWISGVRAAVSEAE